MSGGYSSIITKMIPHENDENDKHHKIGNTAHLDKVNTRECDENNDWFVTFLCCLLLCSYQRVFSSFRDGDFESQCVELVI